MPKPFAHTWWGNAFLTAVEQFTDASRLSRGRTYAKGRKVTKFKIDSDRITAKIRGSINPYFGVYEEPLYSVSIEFEPISHEKWDTIIDRMGAKVSSLSKLLVGEMPDDIEADFESLGLHLLPRKGDVESQCSCPDWNNPCKHIAGVYYLVAAELDRDPLKLFELRGLPRETLLAKLGKTPLGIALRQELSEDPTDETATQQPSTSLHTQPTTHSPQDTLTPLHFWQGSKPLPPLEAPKPAQVPAILIKKQGDFPPFWQRSNSFIETMEELYNRVQENNGQILD